MPSHIITPDPITDIPKERLRFFTSVPLQVTFPPHGMSPHLSSQSKVTFPRSLPAPLFPPPQHPGPLAPHISLCLVRWARETAVSSLRAAMCPL